MENSPVWIVILILAAFVVAISFAAFAQRKIHNQPLKKRRKRLLIMLGFLLLTFLVITIISKIQGIQLWQGLFLNPGFLILLLLFTIQFFYAYFQKDKKQNTTNDITKE